MGPGGSAIILELQTALGNLIQNSCRGDLRQLGRLGRSSRSPPRPLPLRASSCGTPTWTMLNRWWRTQDGRPERLFCGRPGDQHGRHSLSVSSPPKKSSGIEIRPLPRPAVTKLVQPARFLEQTPHVDGQGHTTCRTGPIWRMTADTKQKLLVKKAVR